MIMLQLPVLLPLLLALLFAVPQARADITGTSNTTFPSDSSAFSYTGQWYNELTNGEYNTYSNDSDASLTLSFLGVAALFAAKFWNWVIAFCVPYITDKEYGNLGSKIAFIWFATSLVGAVWGFFFVPETRYHSLEELDEMFEAGLKPWQTAAWKPTGVSLHGAHGADAVGKENEAESVHDHEIKATPPSSPMDTHAALFLVTLFTFIPVVFWV